MRQAILQALLRAHLLLPSRKEVRAIRCVQVADDSPLLLQICTSLQRLVQARGRRGGMLQAREAAHHLEHTAAIWAGGREREREEGREGGKEDGWERERDLDERAEV
jgi:hypothetical protein